MAGTFFFLIVETEAPRMLKERKKEISSKPLWKVNKISKIGFLTYLKVCFFWEVINQTFVVLEFYCYYYCYSQKFWTLQLSLPSVKPANKQVSLHASSSFLPWELQIACFFIEAANERADRIQSGRRHHCMENLTPVLRFLLSWGYRTSLRCSCHFVLIPHLRVTYHCSSVWESTSY